MKEKHICSNHLHWSEWRSLLCFGLGNYCRNPAGKLIRIALFQSTGGCITAMAQAANLDSSSCSRSNSSSRSSILADLDYAFLRFLTWQGSDEVPLQHGFQVGVYVSMLVVAHVGDEVLHKLHLVRLWPLVEKFDADVLLLLVVPLGGPFPWHNHRGRTVTDLWMEEEEEDGRLELQVPLKNRIGPGLGTAVGG